MIGKDLQKAIGDLIADELVAIPTETVYGLAANALSTFAVTKIFEAKNRPTFDPLIVHVPSLDHLEKYVKEIPDWAKRLAEEFWPGALTLLLPKRDIIPDLVTSGSDLVGIRIPQHPLTLELLTKLPFPLAAPSANPFGYISPTTAQHVEDQLGNKISYVLDGGPCTIGLESTIVGMKEGKPTVFRTGGIAVEDLEKVLKIEIPVQASSSKPLAPGMLDSHYAPKKPLHIGNIPQLVQKFHQSKIGILSFEHDYSNLARHAIALSPTHNLNEAAEKLFATMRNMDDCEIDVIITEKFPEVGLGRAINDRLSRASFKK